MLVTRMTTLTFLLLELYPFLVFEFDFVSALYIEYPSQYFDDTWKIKKNRMRRHVAYKNDTLLGGCVFVGVGLWGVGGRGGGGGREGPLCVVGFLCVFFFFFE